MSKNVSRLQHTEIPLRDFEKGFVTIESAMGRKMIQLQLPGQPKSRSLKLYLFSPEEAYTIGSSLVEHAQECGYDYDTGETRDVE